MRCLILLVLFTSMASHASARLISLEKAQQNWQKFLDCRKFKSQDNEFQKCTEGFFSKSLVPPEKNKMREFLDQEIHFSKLHKCADSDLLQPQRVEKGNEVFCFNLEGLQSESFGYLTLIQEKSRFKIKEIKFKY